MDFKEKAIIRLQHWIDHNKHHHEEYELFAEQLEAAGKEKSARSIREMMDYTQKSTECMEEALKNLD